MKPKLKIILLLMTIIVLNSCDGGCVMFFLDDGDIDDPQHFTWLCTINSDGTGLHYLREGGGKPQFTADGSKILVGFSNGFKILDAELGTILVDIDTLTNFYHYTLSNDNKICFSAYSNLTSSADLFLFEPTISSITNITMTDSVGESSPSFNSYYDKVVYTRSNLLGLSSMLFIYDFNTQDSISIVTENLGFTFPQFSLDETQVIFKSAHSYNLYDINEQVNAVIFEGYIEWYPCSIFENEMTFSADSHIWKMNVDGSELMDLGQGHHPQFSPDGTKIAYDGLYIMNSDGTDKQILTDELGEFPHFSPDGSKIVFLMERYEE
ncbi:MAG: hypothetical protein P9L97_03975 [Candidatus Tenebribacter davisii]|jgi:Tol biopolymer transport system component|nr:hypothetical protein [Candidatus Tenebribacter davisii]